MKKTNLFILLLSTLLLASCNNATSEPNNSEQKPTEQESVAPTEAPSVTPTETPSVGPEVDENGFIRHDEIIDIESLVIGVNDSYNIKALLSEKYAKSYMDIYVDSFDYVKPDAEDNINGIKEGKETIKVVLDEEIFDEIEVTIKPQDYINENFKFDYARLHNKTFTVFGDSISDINDSAYPDQPQQYFWHKQLADKYDMTLHSFANSGSTTGYCKELLTKYPYLNTIIGTYIAKNNREAKKSITESDYVFIYFGTNDVSYNIKMGDYDDINDDNYLDTESFRGSYCYLIDTIRKINPNTKVVCLSLTYSGWGQGDYDRATASEEIKKIAEMKHCKYVYLYDLWNKDNISQYAEDGMHPLTVGYDLIVERILNS